MSIELEALPFELDALAPHISKETLEYHYGKHHKAYVDKLNAAIEGTNLAKSSLVEIITTTDKPGIFNNAAQVYNHTFYWNSLTPNGKGEPTGAIKQAIDKAFGSFSDFQEKFTQEAATHFGSGWAWLVKDASGKLEIISTHDAGNPLTEKKTPLLTCDVWEHAYYIDYRNKRPDYLNAYWKLVNWDFVQKNLEK